MDGLILQADVLDASAREKARAHLAGVALPLIVADPPYGRITGESWDKADDEDAFVAWMFEWTRLWGDLLAEGAAFYVWGGIGVPGFRPFYAYLNRVERETGFALADHITWKKKRAYGLPYRLLFCREELAYLCKGDPKKPRCFHIPYLDMKRGYPGYDKDHPAKSEYLRRSNVWDETEILRGKRHPCEKVARVNEVPIEVHTNPGETVVDLFAGSGSLSEAARRLGRRWIAVEKDAGYCRRIATTLVR